MSEEALQPGRDDGSLMPQINAALIPHLGLDRLQWQDVFLDLILNVDFGDAERLVMLKAHQAIRKQDRNPADFESLKDLAEFVAMKDGNLRKVLDGLGTEPYHVWIETRDAHGKRKSVKDPNPRLGKRVLSWRKDPERDPVRKGKKGKTGWVLEIVHYRFWRNCSWRVSPEKIKRIMAQGMVRAAERTPALFPEGIPFVPRPFNPELYDVQSGGGGGGESDCTTYNPPSQITLLEGEPSGPKSQELYDVQSSGQDLEGSKDSQRTASKQRKAGGEGKNSEEKWDDYRRDCIKPNQAYGEAVKNGELPTTKDHRAFVNWLWHVGGWQRDKRFDPDAAWTFAKEFGGQWWERYKENRDKFCRCWIDALSQLREDNIEESVGACANANWPHFA